MRQRQLSRRSLQLPPRRPSKMLQQCTRLVLERLARLQSSLRQRLPQLSRCITQLKLVTIMSRVASSMIFKKLLIMVETLMS